MQFAKWLKPVVSREGICTQARLPAGPMFIVVAELEISSSSSIYGKRAVRRFLALWPPYSGWINIRWHGQKAKKSSLPLFSKSYVGQRFGCRYTDNNLNVFIWLNEKCWCYKNTQMVNITYNSGLQTCVSNLFFNMTHGKKNILSFTINTHTYTEIYKIVLDHSYK